MPATPKPKFYNPRHPERTLLYQTIAEHFETWHELASAGQFDGQGDHHTPKPYVRLAFRKYLECGIFAHGFARAWCDDCGHDYFVAYSCKGRGVCPSCNTRRMVETAAHLTDHVYPRLPVRQWVLSVPKRLRYFMQRDGAVLNMVLCIFLRVIAQSLQSNSSGAAQVDRAALHIGAVAFIHRFCSSLNGHVHFHVCAVDGVFEEVAVAGEADAQSSPPGIVFHPASAIDATAVAQVQPDLRRRILRAFVGRGLLESCDAKEMLAYQHSGFSVDAGVCIEAYDRAGLERLLRYCARPPFAMDRLRKEGVELVYRCAKQRSEPGSDKRGAKIDELHLTPLELIDRIAALVPPPRTHRHRYFGVPAPNSPHRAAVTAMAATPEQPTTAQAEPTATCGGADGPEPMGNPIAPTPEPAPPKRAAHYLWAVLIARIYEVFPLLCPLCGGQMRLIAFITEGTQIRKILDHIGVDSEPPHISPAAGHRCGMTAMRRWMRGGTLSQQTGIWRRNRHPTLRWTSASVPVVLGQLRAGTVKALAVTGECLEDVLPQTPIVAESGVPGWGSTNWFGLFAPKGTPTAIVQTLNQAVQRALRHPTLSATLNQSGHRPLVGTPEDLRRLLAQETTSVKKVIESSGLRAEMD